MVDISYVRDLIYRSQVREYFDPGKAHAGYEKAERMLDMYLLEMGIRRTGQMSFSPDSDLVQQFLPYYEQIMEGYRRLTEKKA